ncbi:hypothetical protein H0H92_013380 [Tricholoma furcatifolium]|nr:hypothetical protein H0H92_013380 [Tricholoma furcatifolium]
MAHANSAQEVRFSQVDFGQLLAEAMERDESQFSEDKHTALAQCSTGCEDQSQHVNLAMKFVESDNLEKLHSQAKRQKRNEEESIIALAKSSKTVEQRRKADAAAARKKNRRIKRATQDIYSSTIISKASAERVAKAFHCISTSFDPSTEMRAAGPGYVGMRFNSKTNKLSWTLPELKDAGFTYVAWDGRTPQMFTDKNGRIMAFLVGQPVGENWQSVCERAAQALDEFRTDAITAGLLSENEFGNRRGDFHAIASGVSMGNGRLEPGKFTHPPALQKLLDRLLAQREIQQIGNFQSQSLFTYAPKLFAWLRSKLAGIMKAFPTNFTKSIFPAVTLNVGPQTQCVIHLDHNNLAHGLCAVTSLGNYNPVRGGHFIFYTLRTVVEFPPGSTLFLPSATMPHGNTPIQDNETRYSVTQYCAGGLIRWVDYGFQTVKRLCSTNTGRKQRAKIDGPSGSRWQWALELFSKFNELADDRNDVIVGSNTVLAGI